MGTHIENKINKVMKKTLSYIILSKVLKDDIQKGHVKIKNQRLKLLSQKNGGADIGMNEKHIIGNKLSKINSLLTEEYQLSTAVIQ